MVRCYDCGSKIPEAFVVRKSVKTGTSRGEHSSRDYYHKVTLCSKCARARDNASLPKGKSTILGLVGSLAAIIFTVSVFCVLLGKQTTLSRPLSETHAAVAQQALELTGTVTVVDPTKHHVGIRHDAIPGQLSAGDHFFVVAQEVAVPVPGAPVGQMVEFVIESRNNQWVITKIKAIRRGPVSSRVDSEDAAIQEAVASFKSQDKAVRDRGITTVIQNARNWKPANCTLIAKELAGVGDSGYLASRALCEIMAAVRIKADQSEADASNGFPNRSVLQLPFDREAFESRKATVQAVLESLRVVNPKLHELVKKGVSSAAINDLVVLGDDGKALAPILEAEILHFVITKYWLKALDHNPISLERVENSLRRLMIVAPDEPNTLNAILKLLRYYLSWCKEGYAGSPRPVLYFVEQLGALGPKANEGLPVLRELALVKNESVKRAAQQSLQKVAGNEER